LSINFLACLLQGVDYVIGGSILVKLLHQIGIQLEIDSTLLDERDHFLRTCPPNQKQRDIVCTQRGALRFSDYGAS
jgi:hypothetical protein